MSKNGKVFYGDRLAGILSETDEGYRFAYNKEYIQSGGDPVSLTMPIRPEAYTSRVLFPFFDGLIPEGWLLNLAQDYWKIDARDRFALLLATCSDAIGAVSVIPEL
jgi:serine/threonine-protein kinase HipA